ncbi:MAG: ribosome small subunit-dependent GTPase A [Actinomycetota bacterium]
MDDRLYRLGWKDDLDVAFEPYAKQGLIPGRVAVEHRGAYVVYTAAGEVWAEPAGRLLHTATDRGDLPAVGDWVVLRPRPNEASATVHAVLPRRSAFSRKIAGFETQEHVLAANIDLVWIVGAMTRELSARRMERYLAMAWESGAQPEIVLTKADLDEADPDRITEVEAIAVGAPVHVTSAVTRAGLDGLVAGLNGDRTAALLGSSGVGKSTLINALIGEERLEVKDTRRDDVGRHTTTRRELIEVPAGGLVIDTPGLREIVMWEADADAVFTEIAVLSSRCRFADCAHFAEPGCAVRGAIADGSLDPDRWRSYEKMQRELAYVEGRKRGRANTNSKQRSRVIAKAMRQRRKLGIDRKS